MKKEKKYGVLLLNLGTPDSPTTKDVRKYLSEFLNDPRVIDISPLARWFLVNFIIVPFRAPKSAKEYKKLFKLGGGRSPLLAYSKSLKDKVNNLTGNEFDIELAMRYGNPSMDDVLDRMQTKNYDEIIIFPLYPQYASASSGSSIEKALNIINKWLVVPEIKVMGQFYDDVRYLNCIKNRAEAFNMKNYDHVLFSYHGLPERHVSKVHIDGKPCADHHCKEEINESNKFCYKATCYATTRHLVKMLGLKEGEYSTSFQSRLGNDPWIKPFTEQVVENIAKNACKRLLVFSPAFIADCLETTIEISEEYLNIFRQNGGEVLDLVPSLNEGDDWAECIVDMVNDYV